MTIKTFFQHFSLDRANITIWDTNRDLLLSGTVHFTDGDNYMINEIADLENRFIESWFINIRGEIFITVYREEDINQN